mmetsp:Transcript_37407/g.33532  ORF Transcript_37407/g.33532 Transcript_37407/m.33532 type:complete len:138 (-) Transcript_37407:793-1206(-)
MTPFKSRAFSNNPKTRPVCDTPKNLEKFLKISAKLQSLNLNFGAGMQQSLQVFAEGLKSQTNLERLTLHCSHTEFNNYNLDHLIPALPCLRSLQVLDLQFANNSLDSKNLGSIFKGIENLSNLRELEINVDSNNLMV